MTYNNEDLEKLLEEGREAAAQKDLESRGDQDLISRVVKHKSSRDGRLERDDDDPRPRSRRGTYDDDERASANGSTSSTHRTNHSRRDRSADDGRRSRNGHSSPRGDSYRRRSRSPRDYRRSDRDHRYSRDSHRHREDDDKYRRGSERNDHHRARSPSDRDSPRNGARSGRDSRGAAPEPTEDERDRRTVFVQQLANRLRTKELEKFFTQVGAVVEAQIVKDRVSGRSKGVGYVEFRDEESVKKAIDLTGQQLLGIPIIVQLTEAEKNRQARTTDTQPSLTNGQPFHRLYVGNIHFNISEDDLKDVFSQYGEVEFVQLQTDDNGRSRGYGFVQFNAADDAKQALAELNGFELAGRPIRVGLGNDKMNQDANTAMMQRLNQISGKNDQSMSFSGSGGRGSHAGGNVNFDRAGGRDDKGGPGVGALDDSEVGGVNFHNVSRDSLMRKLARMPDPAPTNQNGETRASTGSKAAPASLKPSRCIVVKNAYDEAEETGNWERELEEDFQTECSEKYGQVVHCGLGNERSEGAIYVKFKDLKGGDNALKGLNGRFFGGKVLNATPVVDAIYNMNFPKAASL